MPVLALDSLGALPAILWLALGDILGTRDDKGRNMVRRSRVRIVTRGRRGKKDFFMKLGRPRWKKGGSSARGRGEGGGEGEGFEQEMIKASCCFSHPLPVPPSHTSSFPSV
jgi:hypothetical protein